MRLLHVDNLEFAEHHCDDKLPRYVIASHRWVDGSEATFREIQERRNIGSVGYKKVEAFAQYVREHVPSIKWLWIDTCCINKDSAAELSEAINLMFKWYRNAELCLAYLADVEIVEDKSGFKQSGFKQSEWFERGWTLQELLAPRTVVFVTKSWQVIGNKGVSFRGFSGTSTGPGLERDVATITGIPESILHDYTTSQGLSVDMRLRWMEHRKTSREEDMSYALYGIFGVTPGANYGEGHKGARQRLLTAIHQQDYLAAPQAAQFRKIVDWLAPPNPWTNHESARLRHELQTGVWLYQSEEYRAWKYGSISHLWLHGKAGCGKTILCSTAIEDVRAHCENVANAGYAVFYFSFSDNQKQSQENFLRSLVVQLGRREPGLSMLRQAYENRSSPEVGDLKKILLSSIASYDEVYLLIDALDECPENGDVRQNMLEYLGELSWGAPNLRILTTSRDVSEVRASMELLGAKPMSIAAQTIDADIRRYVSAQLLRDRKLSRLDPDTRTLIEETLSQRADGMFRWVYCQLQELKRSKSTKPRAVKAALLALPADLDKTYERMLINIDREDRLEALTLLRWLAYAKSPPSLGELAEATIVDTSADGTVEFENRGGWQDTLEILAGLITTEGIDEGDMDIEATRLHALDDVETGFAVTHPRHCIRRDTKVRLAHFSVKEYLESQRVLENCAKDFYLDPMKEHRLIAEGCLVYLTHYSSSSQKTSTKQDLAAFPLLEYAARSWFYHSSLQQWDGSSRELSLLASKKSRFAWLDVHQPDLPWEEPFESVDYIGSELYYASVVGLKGVVQTLIDTGAEVNAQGGFYGHALQAASHGGYEKVVQMLIDAGAEVNAQGGRYGNALQAASRRGYEKVVQMLIDAGAEVNAQGGRYGNALQAAYSNAHFTAAELLTVNGASFDATKFDCLGRSLMHIAAAAGSSNGLEFGLGQKLDIDTPDNQGWAPSH